jgi:hypothetical protein
LRGEDVDNPGGLLSPDLFLEGEPELKAPSGGLIDPIAFPGSFQR